VFENRVLRRIFGPKRDEVMGGWRRLHNKKLVTSTLHEVQLELSNQGGCRAHGGEEKSM
jgi:hypothetical protein